MAMKKRLKKKLAKKAQAKILEKQANSSKSRLHKIKIGKPTAIEGPDPMLDLIRKNNNIKEKNSYFSNALDGGNQLSFSFDGASLNTPSLQRENDINKIKEIMSKDYSDRSRTENGLLNKYREQYGDLDELIKSTEPIVEPRTKQEIIQDLMNKPESELSRTEANILNQHKKDIKAQSDEITQNVYNSIQDGTIDNFAQPDILEGEQMNMFGKMGTDISDADMQEYANLFDQIESNAKAKEVAKAYADKEKKLLENMTDVNKIQFKEALNNNISKEQLLNAVGDDAEGSKAVLKSIRRNKAKNGTLTEKESAMFNRVLQPGFTEGFDDHVKQARKSMNTMDKYRMWHLEKKGLVDNTTTRVARARMAVGAEVPDHVSQKVVKQAKSSNTLSSITKGNKTAMFGGILSGAMAIADFKEGKKEGKTTVEALGSAAFEFAKSEVLGVGGMLGLGLVKGVPKAAVSVYNEVQSVNRSMNNLQRFTPFADSQFADTQQLATMRQSGMEMAKMANYNLQQTLMGTEAKHLHR